MDPSFPQGLDRTPNEAERLRPLEITEEQKERLTEGQELIEKEQPQTAGVSTEARSCLENLAKAQKTSAAIGDDISGADRTLSDVDARIATQKSLLHPIHHLPPEVLCEIFRRCQLQREHFYNMEVALCLASVCQHWRAVACSFGTLWSFIDMGEDSPQHEELVKVFVERSSPSLALLVPENFWRRISLGFLPLGHVCQLQIRLVYDLDRGIFRTWSVLLPHLSQLRITATPQARGRTTSGDFLSLFPNLKDLELLGVNLHFSEDFKLIKLRRIYWCFSGNYKPGSRVLLGDICSRAPHLEFFTFHGPSSPSPHLTTMDFGPLTELRAMETDNIDLRIMKPLAVPSMIPSLQHLTFRWILSCRPQRGMLLKDTVLHYASLVSLTRLSLVFDSYGGYSRLRVTTPQLDYLLQLQHLTCLDVVGENEATYHGEHPCVIYLCDLVSLCTPKPSFPFLQAINFIGKIKTGVSVDRVIQMARVRTAAAASFPNKMVRLESIVFEECEPLSVTQYRQLRDALGQSNS
jgi:F-box-like